MDDPSNMGARDAVAVGVALVSIAAMAALTYITFIVYGTPYISEAITLAESLAIIALGALILRRRMRPTYRQVALAVAFGVLLYVAQFLIAYLPGFVWNTPPFEYIATPVFVYLPEGLILAALAALYPEQGTYLIMMVPFYIISMIAYFNPIWTPFYFAWAMMGEAGLAMFRDKRVAAVASAILASAADAFMVSQFTLFNFGYYTLPSVLMISALSDVALAAVGAAVGLGIGIRARSAWRP